MVNQSVNEFYSRFLFKIDALPQEAVFPLDIAITIFKNFSPDVRELLISEGKTEDSFGHKFSSGSRKEEYSNKSGSETRKPKP